MIPSNMDSTRSSGLENVALDNVLNFRDVGKTINEFLGERYLYITIISNWLES